MRVILCGACGRMGKMVAEAATERGDEIVCGVDIAPSPMPFPIYHNFKEIKERAEVIIDFSSPEGLAERLEFCRKQNIGIVLAATGFSQRDEAVISEFSRKIPIFQSANYSLGVNLLCRIIKIAAETLGEKFDVEIIERHHKNKKDAPSGTALMLAKSAEEGGQAAVIHALRGGTIVGEHEVTFAGDDEIITLSHSARSRKIFAVGALNAAKWLIGKPAGKYDMDDL